MANDPALVGSARRGGLSLEGFRFKIGVENVADRCGKPPLFLFGERVAAFADGAAQVTGFPARLVGSDSAVLADRGAALRALRRSIPIDVGLDPRWQDQESEAPYFGVPNIIAPTGIKRGCIDGSFRDFGDVPKVVELR